jgi:hypothetical protein
LGKEINKDKKNDLENQNQKLELELLNLNELNEQNKIIIKARIDEFMLYKSML